MPPLHTKPMDYLRRKSLSVGTIGCAESHLGILFEDRSHTTDVCRHPSGHAMAAIDNRSHALQRPCLRPSFSLFPLYPPPNCGDIVKVRFPALPSRCSCNFSGCAAAAVARYSWPASHPHTKTTFACPDRGRAFISGRHRGPPRRISRGCLCRMRRRWMAGRGLLTAGARGAGVFLPRCFQTGRKERRNSRAATSQSAHLSCPHKLPYSADFHQFLPSTC